MVDALRPSIALAMVVTSVLGAFAAFQASEAAGRADLAEARFLADLTVRREIATVAADNASTDLRGFALFEESERLAGELERQARETPAGASELLAAAREARGLVTPDLFVHHFPGLGEHDSFDFRAPRATAQQVLASGAIGYDPDRFRAARDREDDEARRFRAVSVAFAVALFFLSIAELLRRRFHRLFAGFGGAAALVALVLWVAG